MLDYGAIVGDVNKAHLVCVHRWRDDVSGCAWQPTASNSAAVNLIEAPFPHCEQTLAIFFHEVGEHVIGVLHWHHVSEAQYWAWDWAFGKMPRTSNQYRAPRLCMS
jgi:hypothetical protein